MNQDTTKVVIPPSHNIIPFFPKIDVPAARSNFEFYIF
jgi:hypothetical protein